MGVDIFLEAECVKDEAAMSLKGNCLQFNTICDPFIDVVVLHPERMQWSLLTDVVWLGLQPHISKGHLPLIDVDEKVYLNDILMYAKWKCHIRYLYSSYYAKELDDLLTEGDNWSYNQLSIFPPTMIREEEWKTFLQKLQEGIKNILISSGCKLGHE